MGEFLLPVETTSLSLGEHWRLPLHPLYIIRTQRKDSRLTHKYPSSLSNTTQLLAQCHLFLTNYSHSLNLTRHCCATVFKYIPLVAFLRTNKPKTEIRGLPVRNQTSQLMLWCYMVLYLSRSSGTSAIYRRPHWPGIAYFLRGLPPKFEINYVGISKDMGKSLPWLYYIKMNISCHLGFITIGVAMAT